MSEAAKLARNDEVRFIMKEHQMNGQRCIVVRVLPNPSELAIHQWYDVKFEDGTYGRFKEEYLMPFQFPLQ
jgi:hypothetical protein